MYKITEKVLTLVQQLFEEGYDGEVKIANTYYAGAGEYLKGYLAVEISGFCKEPLYLVEQIYTGAIWGIGRYREEFCSDKITVEDIVNLAWVKYQSYKDSGYSRPDEFEDLFIKYGYLVAETILVYKETQR